jgi:hypothetical protein
MPKNIDWNSLFEYRDGYLYWKVTLANNRARKGKKTGISKTGTYLKIGYEYKTYLAHRIIWEMYNGTIEKGLCIDHINGNPQDNRLENLRLVSYSENGRNRKVHRNNKTVGSFFIKKNREMESDNKYRKL